VGTGKLRCKIAEPGGFRAAAIRLSRDGELVLVGGVNANGTDAKIYRTADGSMVSHFKDHAQNIRGCWLSADAAIAATTGNDEVIRVWDAKTGKGIRVVKPEVGLLAPLEATPDGKLVVTCGRAMTILNMETGAKLKTVDPPSGMLVAMPDGKHFLAGQTNGSVIMYSYQTGAPVKTFTGGRALADQLCASADGKRILANAQDGLRVWDVTSGQQVLTLQAPGGFGAVLLSPDGLCFANVKDGTQHGYFELPKK
jgi:WD40 repeat protein